MFVSDVCGLLCVSDVILINSYHNYTLLLYFFLTGDDQ